MGSGVMGSEYEVRGYGVRIGGQGLWGQIIGSGDTGSGVMGLSTRGQGDGVRIWVAGSEEGGGRGVGVTWSGVKGHLWATLSAWLTS